MNERIKELHNQARDFYLQDEYVNLSMKDLHRLVEEKFAQLIIRECADIATMKQHEWHSAGSYILEHFEVIR